MSELGALIRLFVYIVLVVFLIRLWRAALIDSFRANVFALRDELFDFAAAGNISFENPAYSELRVSMNSVIRFAERITFIRMCLSSIVERFSPHPYAKEYVRMMHARLVALSPEQRDYLIGAHFRLQREMLRHMAFKSPLFLSGLAIFKVINRCKGLLQRSGKGLTTKLERQINVIETQAVLSRQQEMARASAA